MKSPATAAGDRRPRLEPEEGGAWARGARNLTMAGDLGAVDFEMAGKAFLYCADERERAGCPKKIKNKWKNTTKNLKL